MIDYEAIWNHMENYPVLYTTFGIVVGAISTLGATMYIKTKKEIKGARNEVERISALEALDRIREGDITTKYKRTVYEAMQRGQIDQEEYFLALARGRHKIKD